MITPGRCIPRVVGLTGGLASGKSTVSKIWATAGAYVIDADAEARAVLQRNSFGLWLVRKRFGDGILAADGSLDRAALARVAFADSESRRALNRRTHPLIISRMVARLFVALFVQCRSIVVLDTPLLFETGSLLPFCTSTVVVYCPEATMLERAISRGMSADDARKRIGSQLSIERKAELGDRIIDNSGTKEELESTSLEVLDALQPGRGLLGYRLLVFCCHAAWISTAVSKVFSVMK